MLFVYVPAESSLKKLPEAATAALPDNVIWIDLVNPTAEEDRAVERLAGIAVPTRKTCRKSRFPAGSISRTAPAT